MFPATDYNNFLVIILCMIYRCCVRGEESSLVFLCSNFKWFVINSTVAQFAVVPGRMKDLKIVAFLLFTVIIKIIFK